MVLGSYGKYSAKSAYESFFLGSTEFRPWQRIWKSWAPPKCQFFYDQQLIIDAGHPIVWQGVDSRIRKAFLYDQEEDTINHLLVGCVFARQFRFHTLRQVGLQEVSPQPDDTIFHEWWERVIRLCNQEMRKGLNSLIVLGAWILWNHCNRCVFDGVAPNLLETLARVQKTAECG